MSKKSNEKNAKHFESLQFMEKYNQFKNSSAKELLEIISNDKNKFNRLAAVYLLGRVGSNNNEIIDVLRNLVSYESNIVRREALLALAKLGDNKYILQLIEFMQKSNDDFEKSVIAHFIGKIGDEKSIEPLLSLFIERTELSSFSAGISIYEIITRIGISPLLNYFDNEDIRKRKAAIWLVGTWVNYITITNQRKIVTSKLLSLLKSELNPSVKLLIAYTLSNLNIQEGANELLSMCLTNQVPNERKRFFWNEIIRFYVYNQKQSSLGLIKKLNDEIINCKSDYKLAEKTLLSLLDKLEEIVSNFDDIFDFSY